jgi:hypothetical protein
MTYDPFGTAKTAIKASFGRYVQPETTGFISTYNPMFQTSERRTWKDNNSDNIAQDSEIGPSPNASFGTLAGRRPDANYQREYNLQYSVGIQRELAQKDGRADPEQREARDAGKMLFVFFRDEEHPRIADFYEHDVLSHDDMHDALSAVVRVVVPLDTSCPICDPEESTPRLLAHDSFKYMYGRQGISVIDLTNPNSELYGQVISAHPFTPGRYYTVRGTKTVLGLPHGTVTQRALIYAVRIHPAAPVSTTDGKCHTSLCKMAREASRLMVQYGSVGHHDWGNRYGAIAAETGRSASEVAAMAGNIGLIDAAIQVVDQWYGSPVHWGIMSAPAAIFGYDLVRDSAGNWWGTGLFAN